MLEPEDRAAEITAAELAALNGAATMDELRRRTEDDAAELRRRASSQAGLASFERLHARVEGRFCDE